MTAKEFLEKACQFDEAIHIRRIAMEIIVGQAMAIAAKGEREACKTAVASLVNCGMGDAWDAGFNSAKEQAISKIHERGQA